MPKSRQFSIVVVFIGALFFLTTARLDAQSLVPDLNIYLDTGITANVTLPTGEIVAIPINLHLTAEFRNGTAKILLDAHPANNDLQVEVLQTQPITASIQALVYPTPTPSPPIPIIPTDTPPAIIVQPTPTPLPPTVIPPTAIPTAAAAPSGDSVPAVGINADVMTGNLRWRVISVQDRGNRLHSDNPFTTDATTAGRFIQVEIEIEDKGMDSAAYWTPTATDAQGRSYDAYTGRAFYTPSDKQCVFTTFNPGIPKR